MAFVDPFKLPEGDPGWTEPSVGAQAQTPVEVENPHPGSILMVSAAVRNGMWVPETNDDWIKFLQFRIARFAGPLIAIAARDQLLRQQSS